MSVNESRVSATDIESGSSTLPGSVRPERWKTAARWIISVAALALVVYVVDWAEFFRVASSARLDVLALALALLVLGNLIIAWRWQMLLVPVGVHASLGQAFKSYHKGLFIGYFVPSGITADVVKAVDMKIAKTGGRTKKGMELASSIFIERGFGAITVAIAVLLGLLISPLGGDHAEFHEVMLLASFALVACCLLALFADKFLKLAPDAMVQRFPKVGALVDRARDSFVAYRRAPGRLVSVMLLSVVIQALRVVPIYIISISIGVGGEFFPYLIAVPIIFLMNTVPVLGSRIGTEQGFFVLFLGLAGISPESALVIAMLSLALGILVALPGGYWLIKGQAAEPPPL